MQILTGRKQKSLQEIILSNITIQLGLVDLFQTINLEPNFMFGYEIYELVTAYQDGVLTLQQILECAFVITSYLCENPPMVAVYLVEHESASVKYFYFKI